MRSLFIAIILFVGVAPSLLAQNQAGWIKARHPTPEQAVAWLQNASTTGSGGSQSSALPQAMSASSTTSFSAASPPPTPTPGGNEADEITPAISALARGLEYDPLKIFEYVHNYIAFEAYYGSKKGANLTLQEGSGNDFDQCSLLVALLRASGKSPSYKFSACDFSYAQLTTWMGLSPTPFLHLNDLQFTDYFGGVPATVQNRKGAAVYFFLTEAGFFRIQQYTYGGDEWFRFPHVWVQLTDGGTTRRFTPSVKDSTDTQGVNLTTASAYSRSQILTDAAGSATTSPDSITNLNYSALESRLGSYTQNILTYIKNNGDARASDQITGSRNIVPVYYTNLIEPLPEPPLIVPQPISPPFVMTTPWLSLQTWTAIPEAQMSKIQIKAGTYNYAASPPAFSGSPVFDQTIKMPALGGRKLSLSFSGNTGKIFLDEVQQGSDFTITGSSVDVQLNVTHNHFEKVPQGSGYVDTALTKHNQTETKKYLKADGNAYAFIYAFANPDKTAQKRQEVLDGYRRRTQLPAGDPNYLTEGDWRIRTEILNVMGLQWLYQTWQQERVTAPLYYALPVNLHRFGRAAQEGSYYVDVGLQLSAAKNRDLDAARDEQFFNFSSLLSSAMEHGVLEQMQGDGKSAASTVKLIYLANQQSIPIYRATASNWSAIRDQLINYSGAPVTAGAFVIGVQYRITTVGSTNFTAVGAANNSVGTVFTATGIGSGTGTASPTGTAEMESVVTAPSGQGRALVPKNGQITLNQWKGYGYATEEPGSTNMKISGGLFGGFNSTPGAVNLGLIATRITSDPSYSISNSGLLLRTPYTPYNTPQRISTDPVEMASGAFILDKTELTLGRPELTRGLSFSRHYNSNRRFDKSAGLGYGWTHNYDISAVMRSSTKAGLGETISYHAAPFFAALAVASDLSKNHATAKEWATAALVIHWAVEQLKYKGVAISMGNKTIEFVKMPNAPSMPNGTYQAPAAMNLTLTRQGPAGSEYFTMTERHGPTYTFQADGKIDFITDLWNKKLEFTYAGGKLSEVKDAYLRALTFNWAGERISSVTDATGRSVGFSYTGDDLTGCTDVESKTWTYTPDADHRLTHIYDPSARLVVQNFYDGESRVGEQRTFGALDKKYFLTYTGYTNIEENPQAGRTAYQYDSRGRSIATVDALGNRMRSFYDGQDRTVKTISAKNEITELYHDKFNNLYHVKDSAGHHSYTSYDTQNRVETITDKRGKVTTVNTYNVNFQPTKVTAPLNRITLTNYTATGEVDTVTDPELNVTDYDYNALGEVEKVKINTLISQEFPLYTNRGDVEQSKDAVGRITTMTYNKRRQLRTSTLPAVPGEPAAVIEQTYDNDGNLQSTKDARLNTTSYTYTATGKLKTTTYPAIPVGGPTGTLLNNVVTVGYNTRDWPETTVNSLAFTTSVIYDAAQRPEERKDELNRSNKTVFDRNGRPEQITDPLLRVTKMEYYPRGEVKKNIDGLTKQTVFGYDENGNRTSLKNRRNKDYIFAFDDAGRHFKTTTPTLKETVTEYWQNDLPKKVTEPSLQETDLVYDTRLRLFTKEDDLSKITYGYEDNGNLKTVSEGYAIPVTANPTLTRTYDERSRLRTFTNADGDLIKYDYDAANNLTGLTYPTDTLYPAGRKVIYTYNARNQLETVKDWSNRTTTYQYDRLGRLKGILRPNGTSQVIELDAAGQVLSTRELAGTRLFHYQKFKYDLAGQVKEKFTAPTGRPATLPAFAATYDNDNRFSTINGQSIGYDPDGNMTLGPITATSGSLSLAYNARNQLTGAGNMTYTYDAEGHRRTAVTSISASPATPTTPAIPAHTLTTRYTIDPAGTLSRCLIKHETSSLTPGTTTKTYYVYGLGLLYEATKIGAAAETTITHHYDQVGSTVVRTDDTGNDVGRAEYSPYGQLTWKTGNMNTPFLYNGGYGVMSDSNGLLNMRARYYSPYLMRFLNADPIGFSGGQNWFSYADGNPINRLDPMGLSFWSVTGNFLKGVVVGAVVTAAVIVAAPVVVAGLVTVGLTAAAATATVTTGLGIAGAYYGAKTVVNVASNISEGNWDEAAYGAGTLVGGAAVGIAGGGRYIADNASPAPSTVPRSWSLRGDKEYGFERNPELPLVRDLWNWLGTGPTPQSGGGAAALIGSGAAAPNWFGGPSVNANSSPK